ncbi:LOW QUALITY PROTEIN: uncharacterized protein LOC110029532 [Phalaenopsis equestris]|uniref:LOW QUALITY PROTEIN: uncharacterized protein LOC110029532 n=1 Tax=Phalaenopsis equestris TaxID=78828 RepID=UPI0009E42EBB|nr:LOW QUALITY PROTEIN: uncharacterized protein LOC110029532 [Phalaenopsis equestris]
MAYHSKFLSVNLNKSYGKPSVSSSPSSSAAGYGNGGPRSAVGGGAMVVLSRPRSSSGATAHKPAQRLAVPPPVNLPSLRKEHERLDPALSKPSSGHGGSGLGIGNNSSMSWTKPTPPMEDSSIKAGGSRSLSAVEQRSFSKNSLPQGFMEKPVILRGEDFPSLMATSTYVSKQKQKQVSDNTDGLVEKTEPSSVVDMSSILRSSPQIKKNVQGSEGGSKRLVLDSLEQSRQGAGNFPGPLPIVRLRHTSDWDDDERDRNHVDHYDEARSSLSRDKEFMALKKEDRNFSSWRVTVEPNREILSSRALHVDKDHFSSRNLAMSKGTGKESNYDRLVSSMGIGNGGVTEGSNDRDEVSNNWQRGKPYTNSMISRVKGGSTNDSLHNFTKESLMPNVGRSYAEDASWGGKDTFSSEAMLDLKAKVLRKKKESEKHTDIFDPARESFEAELERVQLLQEQERRRVMEEQARVMEAARREAEERERVAREEEERRRLLEEEAREAAWRAEQEKLEAARRAEELRIAREEEKKKVLLEEERRKEAARQKLLELEARIASREAEANANDRMHERNTLRDSDLAKCEKTETMLEHSSDSPLFNLSSMNRLSESGFRPHTLSVENHSFVQHRKNENNYCNTNNSTIKFQDQDGFCSNRNFHRKQFQGTHGPKPITSSFKRGVSSDQAQTGHNWDRNRDFEQFNGRSKFDSMIGGWEHGHFDGSQLESYSERSFQSSEVGDSASFNRVRHSVRQPRVPPPPSMSSSIHRNARGAASDGPNSSFSVHGDAGINQTIGEEESDVRIDYHCDYHQRIIDYGVEPRIPELMEEPACSSLQTEEKNSPRYDSQSSLSISNPPSSPTQLSHDEFDNCGAAEEENMIFSEGKSMIPELDAEKDDAENIHLSHGEDDDWAINNEKTQDEEEEEDHDEDPDGNQEDNEVHESYAWKLQMKKKHEDLNVVVEKSVEIGASGHFFLNEDSKYQENTGMNAEHVSDSTAERVFAEKILNASAEIKEETVKEQEDMIFGLATTADHPTDSIRASKNSGQNPIVAVSRSPLPSSSSPCSVSDSLVPPTPSDQNDEPAKLQFGLFSSPPLIPSPIPTIQIGSIQMPIPLNAQIDSYTHIHPSRTPLFQFGQILYTPSASQNVVPLAATVSSYAHRLPSVHHLINDDHGSSSKNQAGQVSTTAKGLEKENYAPSAEKQPVCAPGITDPSQSNLDSERSAALLDVPRDDLISKRRITSGVSDEKKDFHNFISGSGNSEAISNKNFKSMVYSKRARGRPPLDSFSSARNSDIKGNRMIYNVRNSGTLSSFARTEASYGNSNRFQRRLRRHIQGTEYRVKEIGTKQINFTESFNYSSYNVKPNSDHSLVGIASRNVGRKVGVMNKSKKLMNEEASLSGLQDIKKETLQASMAASSDFAGSKENLNKNGILLDEIDAPLLSGVVRVFNQPGIEASSDGDGFVEVRSKRKISNERRGQRERETNSKHKATRVPHRHRSSFPNNGIAYKPDPVTTLAVEAAAKNVRSDPVIARTKPSMDLDAAKLTTTNITCQTIASFVSSNVNSADYDSKFDSFKSSRTASDFTRANDGANVEPSLYFGNSIVALDKASVPLGTWGTVHLSQPAATSIQSQLEETSNPVQFNPVVAAEVSSDDKKHVSTSLTKERLSFSSGNLPNFPFDGEKIQFGAVSSRLHLFLLPAKLRQVEYGPLDLLYYSSIVHNLPRSERNFFDKEKSHSESCTHLDDNEAEAEAAASAVAVSVITNDDITASTVGTDSISGIGTKGISCPDAISYTNTTGQLASKESLIVTLPADLSVDTPLSLYPPLPTIQSPRPILSNVGTTQHSHFPYFDTNPMLGGPIFTFSPQDKSIVAQEPQQPSSTFVSGPTGTFPQCHSNVESSFYGSPAGFPAPFMSSPAGLSGIHGHPPMVFYNHFAPIGQFARVGLSYMGGTYLPSGKKPEWKHTRDGATATNASKADPGDLNVVYGQQNVAHAAKSIQHLANGSGFMQVNSPFTLFNLRPFQSSTEIPVPAQWPPIPHPHSPNPIQLPTPPERPNIASPNPPRSAAIDLPDELNLIESSTANSIISGDRSTNGKNDSSGIIPDPAHKPGGSPPPQKISAGSQYGRRNTFNRKYGSNNASKVRQIYVAKSQLTSSGASS